MTSRSTRNDTSVPSRSQPNELVSEVAIELRPGRGYPKFDQRCIRAVIRTMRQVRRRRCGAASLRSPYHLHHKSTYYIKHGFSPWLDHGVPCYRPAADPRKSTTSFVATNAETTLGISIIDRPSRETSFNKL